MCSILYSMEINHDVENLQIANISTDTNMGLRSAYISFVGESQILMKDLTHNYYSIEYYCWQRMSMISSDIRRFFPNCGNLKHFNY